MGRRSDLRHHCFQLERDRYLQRLFGKGEIVNMDLLGIETYRQQQERCLQQGEQGRALPEEFLRKGEGNMKNADRLG